MKGFVGSIEKAALKNKTFRTVLYTAKNCQLVVMSLKPGEDIGAESTGRRPNSDSARKRPDYLCRINP
jgi:hypothetical protein